MAFIIPLRLFIGYNKTWGGIKMAAKSQEKVIKTVCSLCYSTCGVLARVKDGKVVDIKGDPDHPTNRGGLCPKGLAGIELLYHPDRLNYPLKRAGKKGEGKWQRISWDEALDTIAGKLKEIKERYGPEAISTAIGAGLYSNAGITGYFGYLLGTPNRLHVGYICFLPAGMATLATIGYPTPNTCTEIVLDEVLNSSCILLWAANPKFASPYPLGQGIFDVRKKGTKLIVVDPYPTDYAKVADLWLRIRPGTDDALALGMMNVIINEGLYDKEFVRKWCFGFDELKEHVQQYPPEKVAEITWIPAGDIVAAARMFARTRPSCICQRVSLDHSYNSVQTSRATFILTAICGNLDVKGGNPLPAPMPFKAELTLAAKMDELPLEVLEKRIGAKQFPIASGPKVGIGFVEPFLWADAVLTGKPYRVRALVTSANNSLLQMQDTKRVWQALEKLDFSVTLELFMTPTAELSDIVLPVASWLERDGIRGQPSYPQVIGFQHKAVEPLYERRDDVEIFIELARRMGLDIPWQNLEEFSDDRLAPKGITFQDMKGKNFIAEPKEYERHEKGKFSFKTPSKKVELYSSFLEQYGYDPLPSYKAPPQTTPEFPLILVGGRKSMEYIHSAGRELPMLRQRRPEPTIDISPETAGENGIRDGDWVWIETIYFGDKERVRFKAELVEGLHPQVVRVEHGWWFPEKPGPEHGCFESNINVIIPNDVCDPIIGSTNLRSVPCRIYKDNGR
jgi:anaerobic selenocysteine-containing dehydrogenase